MNVRYWLCAWSLVGQAACAVSPTAELCGSVLKDGVRDERSVLWREARMEQLERLFCSSTSSSDDSSGFLKFKGVELGGGQKKAETSTICEQLRTKQIGVAQLDDTTRVASQAVLDAWTACIGTAADQVIHYFVPTSDPKIFFYRVQFQPGELQSVKIETLSFFPDNACTTKGKTKWTGEAITRGGLEFECARPDIHTQVTASLNTRGGKGQKYLVGIHMPAVPRVPPPPVLKPDPLYLADHFQSLMEGEPHNVHGTLTWGEMYWNSPIVIAGHTYTKGAGMHAPASGVGAVYFRVPPGAHFFLATFGHAQEPGVVQDFGKTLGRVFLDTSEVWRGEINNSTQHLQVIVSVTDGKLLRLEVDALGSAHADHSAWGDPRFTTKPR